MIMMLLRNGRKRKESKSMKIYFEIEECKNEELLEKMGQIKSYEEFAELAGEYGWNECVDAFAATHSYFDEYYCKEWLYNCFFGGEGVEDTILYFAIDNALEHEEKDLLTAAAALY